MRLTGGVIPLESVRLNVLRRDICTLLVSGGVSASATTTKATADSEGPPTVIAAAETSEPTKCAFTS
jgi:hypothetical protein